MNITEQAKEIFDNIKTVAPVVHNISNYITATDCANMTLACGGSPTMADDPDEVADISAGCNGCVINMGNTGGFLEESMLRMGRKNNAIEHPVIFDPVGAGAAHRRNAVLENLMNSIRFTVIRGNISEIKTLALGSGTTKGVDADVADAVTDANLDSAVKFVKDFAAKSGAIVAVTGAIDLVSDGTACYVIRNGRPEMGKITGTGCQLSGMMTAFVVANPDNKLEAAAAAVCAMGLAGEIGWSRMAEGDGNSTYRNRIIDAIYNMDGATLNGGAKYELR